MSQDQNLLTTGSVVKKMLLFAVPIFFSNLFQQLYNAVDSLIVGKFYRGRSTGSSWFFGKPDHADDRLYQWCIDGCRRTDCPIFWGTGR